MPDALVLSVRRLISDAAVPDEGSGVVAPLVLQASQRVVTPSLEPMVLTRADGASADQAEQEPPKPAAPLSHDPNIWRSLPTSAAPWPVRCATNCRALFEL